MQLTLLVPRVRGTLALLRVRLEVALFVCLSVCLFVGWLV